MTAVAGAGRRPVFLIGYMCSGKTTLGRALSRATGREFVDLDEYVEARAGMSVSEIFAVKGEAEFRRLESEALAGLSASPGAPIVACGGGTPCHGRNMELMNGSGLTVLLECGRERLLRRLRERRSGRPLIAGLDDEALERHAMENNERRRPWYEQALLRFDSTYLETEEEVAASVDRFISTIIK